MILLASIQRRAGTRARAHFQRWSRGLSRELFVPPAIYSILESKPEPIVVYPSISLDMFLLKNITDHHEG